MNPQREGRKVAIAGASGNIGRKTLEALLSHGIHTITAIVRPESKSVFPEKVKIENAAYDDESALVRALSGHDILLLQLPMRTTSFSTSFVRAAAKAGVKYILPTEFGSDPEAKLMDELPEIAEKQVTRELIENLGVSSWIAIINNPWYDYCLPLGEIIGIDIKSLKATLWDGGNTMYNTTTMSRVAQATAEVIALPQTELDKYCNNCFYISSFYLSQRDVLESVMRATGTSYTDWSIREESSDEAIARANRMTDVEPHEIVLAKVFPLHFKAGYGGDFNGKVEPLDRFGLGKEDLEKVTESVIKNMK